MKADEQVRRPVVELLWSADLLRPAFAQHRDPIGHRHRLDLVVRDVDRRDRQAHAQPRDVGTHLYTQLCVEIGQGLVHQEQLRLAHDRAPQGDALSLAAGERARAARELLPEAQAA